MPSFETVVMLLLACLLIFGPIVVAGLVAVLSGGAL